MRTALVLVALLVGPALASAQTVTAFQSEPMTYRISGRIPGAMGVSLSGSVTGFCLCTSDGSFDGRFLVASPFISGVVTATPIGGGAPTQVSLTNAAPQTTLSVSPAPFGKVRMVGVVTDEVSAGLIVTVTGGGPGLNGHTATCFPSPAGGLWAIEVPYTGPISPITATVTDWLGRQGTRTFP